jgi:hypothetical protein
MSSLSVVATMRLLRVIVALCSLATGASSFFLPKGSQLMSKFLGSALVPSSSSSSSRNAAKTSAAIGFDSHTPLAHAPETMVRGCDGDESMRRKFEAMIRKGQLEICAAIEEVGRASIQPVCAVWIRCQ